MDFFQHFTEPYFFSKMLANSKKWAFSISAACSNNFSTSEISEAVGPHPMAIPWAKDEPHFIRDL